MYFKALIKWLAGSGKLASTDSVGAAASWAYLVLQPLSGAAPKSNLFWHLRYDLTDSGTEYLCAQMHSQDNAILHFSCMHATGWAQDQLG